jgi:triosephosphate isomerase
MKKIFIIGNWKSYKTAVETTQWFQQIANHKSQISNLDNKEIILCVPFTVLALAKSLIEQHDLPIKLGAQDISPFGEGKYTGEVNGKQIAEFAKYVIIGHSERRKYFKEDEEMIAQKIQQAIGAGLIPILCVSEIGQVSAQPHEIASPVHQLVRNDVGNMIIAYEPLFAIGSGNPDTPENADKVISEIQNEIKDAVVIYGGSVTSENVHGFTAMPTISGVLPGGASLEAKEFSAIVKNA